METTNGVPRSKQGDGRAAFEAGQPGGKTFQAERSISAASGMAPGQRRGHHGVREREARNARRHR